MPILGNAAILAVAACVVLARAVPGAFALSLAALILIIGDMAVTLGGNVPINQQVQSWEVAAPPPERAALRDRWEKLHCEPYSSCPGSRCSLPASCSSRFREIPRASGARS